MPFKFESKKPITEEMVLKLELNLFRSSLTPEEAAQRIEYLINSPYSKEFSGFIVFLLRETKSSSWELKSLELNKVE